MKQNINLSKYALGILLVLFLLSLAKGEESDTSRINLLLKRATQIQRTDEDSCLLLSRQALALSQKIKYPKGISGAYIRIGSILFTDGKYDSALFLISQAYQIRLNLNDQRTAAGACLLMSYIYQEKSKQDSAYAYLYEAIKLNEAVKDTENMINNLIALGYLNEDYKNGKAAKLNFESAAKLAVLSHHEQGLCSAYNGLANNFFYTGSFKIALRYYELVDSLNRKLEDVVGLAQNVMNLGLCHENLLNYPLAKKYYYEAIAILKQMEMENDLALAYYNIGNLYHTTKESDSSVYYLKLSAQIATKTGDLDRALKCYELLAQAYLLKGDYKQAFHYQEIFSVLSDSVLNKEKVTQIAEMQTKYETEQKQIKLELLQEQNISKTNQRNFFMLGSGLLLLLAGAIWLGLRKTNKEKKVSDELLLNILPSEVAFELKKTGTSAARQYNHVSVLFTDFINFTGISETMQPTELVREIHQNFTAFDRIIEKHKLEKIKTIGDAYLAVCGLPQESPDHAKRVVMAALDIQQYMKEHAGKFQIRIGIHSGPVVAGIVGVKKYAYDIWGDTVNTAARMEQYSEAGKVNISGATYTLISEEFECEYRGKVNAKNKGEIDMYFVNRSQSGG